MPETLNHAKLRCLFRRELALCNVQKGETIVLLSDLGRAPRLCLRRVRRGEDLGPTPRVCVNAMPSWTKVGVETVGRCKARSRRSSRRTCLSACTSAVHALAK